MKRGRVTSTRELTPDEVAALRREVEAGKVKRWIAKQYGISEYRLLRYCSNLPMPRPRRLVTEAMIAEMIRRREAGETCIAIARSMKISLQTVSTYTRDKKAVSVLV